MAFSSEKSSFGRALYKRKLADHEQERIESALVLESNSGREASERPKSSFT